MVGGEGPWTNDTIFKASCETNFISRITLYAPFSIYASSTFPFNSLRLHTPMSSAGHPSLSLLIKHWRGPPLRSPHIHPSPLVPAVPQWDSLTFFLTKIVPLAFLSSGSSVKTFKVCENLYQAAFASLLHTPSSFSGSPWFQQLLVEEALGDESCAQTAPVLLMKQPCEVDTRAGPRTKLSPYLLTTAPHCLFQITWLSPRFLNVPYTSLSLGFWPCPNSH